MGTSATAAEQVNNIDRLLQRQSIYDTNYDSDDDDYNDNCVATISIKSDTREVEPVNSDICVGNQRQQHWWIWEACAQLLIKVSQTRWCQSAKKVIGYSHKRYMT